MHGLNFTQSYLARRSTGQVHSKTPFKSGGYVRLLPACRKEHFSMCVYCNRTTVVYIHVIVDLVPITSMTPDTVCIANVHCLPKVGVE